MLGCKGVKVLKIKKCIFGIINWPGLNCDEYNTLQYNFFLLNMPEKGKK